jgi:hypothetical protein
MVRELDTNTFQYPATKFLPFIIHHLMILFTYFKHLKQDRKWVAMIHTVWLQWDRKWVPMIQSADLELRENKKVPETLVYLLLF